MAVIDQVSQFLPYQSVCRNKKIEYNCMRKYFHLLLSINVILIENIIRKPTLKLNDVGPYVVIVYQGCPKK